jgi:hypothetical protein
VVKSRTCLLTIALRLVMNALQLAIGEMKSEPGAMRRVISAMIV